MVSRALRPFQEGPSGVTSGGLRGYFCRHEPSSIFSELSETLRYASVSCTTFVTADGRPTGLPCDATLPSASWQATLTKSEGDETATAAAFYEPAAQKPLPPPALSVATDDVLKWNDLIPHLDGGTPPRRRSTQDLSSMSPSSSVGGFSSSATLLSDGDDYSCDANMSSRESAAQLFEDADKAIAECYFAPVDMDGMPDLAGEAFRVDCDADVKPELSEFPPSRAEEGDGGYGNASINSCSMKIEQDRAWTPAYTRTEGPAFDVAGQASPGSADSAAAKQEEEEEDEEWEWEWFDSKGNVGGSQEGNVTFGWLKQVCGLCVLVVSWPAVLVLFTQLPLGLGSFFLFRCPPFFLGIKSTLAWPQASPPPRERVDTAVPLSTSATPWDFVSRRPPLSLIISLAGVRLRWTFGCCSARIKGSNRFFGFRRRRVPQQWHQEAVSPALQGGRRHGLRAARSLGHCPVFRRTAGKAGGNCPNKS